MYSIYLLISADVCLLQLRGNLSLKQLEKRILCVKLYGCLSCQDCLRMGDYSTFQSWNGLIEHSFALVLHRFKYTKSPVLRACQRLSLLTSFEETLRHCFPEDRPEHWLSSTEESFVRLESRRDELRKGERGRLLCPRRRLFLKALNNVGMEAIGVPPGRLWLALAFSPDNKWRGCYRCKQREQNESPSGYKRSSTFNRIDITQGINNNTEAYVVHICAAAFVLIILSQNLENGVPVVFLLFGFDS